MMNPELFVERTKTISPSAVFVSCMFLFVLIMIIYTQWEYTENVQKQEVASNNRREEERNKRKEIIKKVILAEEAMLHRMKQQKQEAAEE